MLDGGDFEHLTISSQLAIMEELLGGDAAHLVGSSMGGYLAALYASRHPEVERVVLLAPAFAFTQRWHHLLGEEKLGEWRATGSMEVFHYGTASQRQLSYRLFEDAQGYPEFPNFLQDGLIFHGRGDAVVPVELSRRFVASHANAELTEMESDHELTDVLSVIIDRSQRFLLG